MGMKLISVKIPDAYLEGLEILVKVKKLYPNRSEAIRVAIRDLLRRELWKDEGRNVSIPPDLMAALKEDVVKEITT
ncbi:MAG: ribbon-helix-helix domain-containing protein [Candidatus Baldrarchaeia archaeon]